MPKTGSSTLQKQAMRVSCPGCDTQFNWAPSPPEVADWIISVSMLELTAMTDCLRVRGWDTNFKVYNKTYNKEVDTE